VKFVSTYAAFSPCTDHKVAITSPYDRHLITKACSCDYVCGIKLVGQCVVLIYDTKYSNLIMLRYFGFEGSYCHLYMLCHSTENSVTCTGDL
jgi:hypothetical protein